MSRHANPLMLAALAVAAMLCVTTASYAGSQVRDDQPHRQHVEHRQDDARGNDRDHDRDREYDHRRDGDMEHGRFDGDRDRDGDGRHSHYQLPMSEKQIDEALALLKKVRPALAQRLAQVRDESPQRVGWLIEHRFPHLRYLLELKENDPDMYELRVDDVRLSYESQDLAEQYRQAQKDNNHRQVRELRSKLEKLVESHFEVRQKIRQLELKRLEQRIEDLREQIEKRDDDRDELVEQRLGELVGTDEGVRW